MDDGSGHASVEHLVGRRTVPLAQTDRVRVEFVRESEEFLGGVADARASLLSTPSRPSHASMTDSTRAGERTDGADRPTVFQGAQTTGA